jgi:hypothetical protein
MGRGDVLVTLKGPNRWLELLTVVKLHEDQQERQVEGGMRKAEPCIAVYHTVCRTALLIQT